MLSGLRPAADGWGHGYQKIHAPPPWLDSGDGGDGSDSGDDDDAKYAKRLAHLMKTDPEFAPPAYVGVSVPRGERARGSCCDCKE